MKKSALTGILAAALLAAGACSTTSTVNEDDVKKQVTDFVDSRLGTSESVDCPTLDAEKDKSITCTAKVDGEEHKIKVTVTDVTDDEAKFDIELADSGSSSTTTTEETTSASRTRTSESTTRRTTSSRTTTESAEVTTDAGEPGYVLAADVEEQIDTQLTASVGRSPDSVSCPDDLVAELDATLTCELTDGPDVYDVYVTVTSVEGTDVLFDIQVADTPQ